jgi:hypothetical protein
MLSNKVNELFENNIFKNIKEYVLSNSLFNYMFVGLFLGVFYLFDFGTLTKFSLFLLTLKFLLNMDKYSMNDKIKYMTNLLKFWMFYAVVTMSFDLFNYICNLTLFNKGIQLYLIYYFYKQSINWFSNNNFMISNSNEVKTELNGSVTVIDNTLNKIVKVYGVNKLSLDFSLNTIAFLLNKFNTVTESLDNNIRKLFSKKELETNEELKETEDSKKETNVHNEEFHKIKESNEKSVESTEKIAADKKDLLDNQMDLLLDSILQETLGLHSDDNIDHIDDENYSIFTKKHS